MPFPTPHGILGKTYGTAFSGNLYRTGERGTKEPKPCGPKVAKTNAGPLVAHVHETLNRDGAAQ